MILQRQAQFGAPSAGSGIPLGFGGSLSAWARGNHQARRDSVANIIAGTRLDDNAGGIFFLRQLEEIDKRLFQVKYLDLQYLQLIPLIPGISAAKETYTWRIIDSRGKAHWGLPDAGLSAKKTNIRAYENYDYKIRSMNSGFGWNVQEIRAAAEVGISLDTYEAAAAQRAIQELSHYTAFFGNAEYGIYGLLNQPNVQTYTPTEDGNHVTTWIGSLKTGQQVLDDLVGMVDQVEISTGTKETIDTILMPLANLRYIQAQPYTPGAGGAYSSTIYDQFLKIRPGIKITWVRGLETAGTGGVSRMIGYRNNESVVGLINPVPFEMFSPFWTGTSWETTCHARIGDVVVRYPQGIIYGDGM
jgi:hypothetical protein